MNKKLKKEWRQEAIDRVREAYPEYTVSYEGKRVTYAHYYEDVYKIRRKEWGSVSYEMRMEDVESNERLRDKQRIQTIVESIEKVLAYLTNWQTKRPNSLSIILASDCFELSVKGIMNLKKPYKGANLTIQLCGNDQLKASINQTLRVPYVSMSDTIETESMYVGEISKGLLQHWLNSTKRMGEHTTMMTNSIKELSNSYNQMIKKTRLTEISE